MINKITKYIRAIGYEDRTTLLGILLTYVLLIGISTNAQIEFTVTLNDGSASEPTCTFNLSSGESESKTINGRWWAASYDQGYFNAYYKAYSVNPHANIKELGNGRHHLTYTWSGIITSTINPWTLEVRNFITLPKFNPTSFSTQPEAEFSHNIKLKEGGGDIVFSVHKDGEDDNLAPLPEFLSYSNGKVTGTIPSEPKTYWSFYYDVRADNYAGHDVVRVHVYVNGPNITAYQFGKGIPENMEENPKNLVLIAGESVPIYITSGQASSAEVEYNSNDCYLLKSSNNTSVTSGFIVDRNSNWSGSLTAIKSTTSSIKASSQGNDGEDTLAFTILNAPDIKGYFTRSGPEVAKDKEDDPSQFIVSEPFKISLSAPNYRANNLKGRFDFTIDSAVEVYTDSNLTNKIENTLSVDLEDPTGPLAPLVTNGNLTLYIDPLGSKRSASATLTYMGKQFNDNGSAYYWNRGRDSINFQIKLKGPNITGYRPTKNGFIKVPEHERDGSDDLTPPPGDPEENPRNLIIVETQEPAKYPDDNRYFAKLKLNKRGIRKGKIIFDIPEDSVVVYYNGKEFPRGSDNWECVLDGNGGATGGLRALKDGDIELMIKGKKTGDVTAQLRYNGPQSLNDSVDTLRFTVTSFCACSADTCVIGGVEYDIGSINGEISLGTGSFGEAAGNIIHYSPELDMTCASPDSFQIAAGSGTSVVVDDAGRTQEITTGTNKVIFTYETENYNGVEYYKKTIMNFFPAGGGDSIRTLTFFNNFTYQGNDEAGEPVFTIDSFECTDSFAGNTKTFQFTQDESGDLNLMDNGIPKSMTESTQGDITSRTYYIGPKSNPVSVRIEQYKKFPWGSELVYLAENGQGTIYEYYVNPDSNGMYYGKLRKITYPKGNYTEYVYNLAGDVYETISREGGNSFKEINTLTEKILVNDIMRNVTTDPASGIRNYTFNETDTIKTVGQKIQTVRRCNDTVISKSETLTYYDYSLGPDEYSVFDQTGSKYTNYTYKINNPTSSLHGKPLLVKNYNGSVSKYSYSRNGDIQITTVESGEPDDFSAADPNIINGSRSITHTNEKGIDIYNVTYDIASGTKLTESNAIEFDTYGRVTKTQYMDGTTTQRAFGCCGVDWEIDRNGAHTDYMYDENKRLISSTTDGISTLYTYDAAGNTLTTTIKGRNGTELTSTNTYNNSVLSKTTDPMNNTTTYTLNGDRVTYPNGTTSITSYNQGVVSGVSGTAVHPVTYSYGPNWQKTMPADVTTYTDMLGQQFKTVYADGTYSQNYYNSKGQVYKQVSPGGMINLTEYDGLGRVYRNAVDMNRNGVIDADDEITVYAYSYSTRGGKNVSVSTVSRVVGTDSKVLSVSENSVDGMDSWVTVNGLTSHTSVSYNGNGSVQTTATNPDGSSSVTTSVYGKTITVQQYNNDNTPGNLVTYTYDEFNRVASITETYGATTVNSTVYSDYNANGQPGTVTVNGRATTYVYDNMGRRTSLTSPGTRTVNYGYSNTGELASVSGADTYTQAYAYDAQGRMSTLTTYKDASTPQVTSWIYNNRGFMTGKTYADGNGVTYDYNADGQLTLRTWARGITTAYVYDHAGRQTGIDYSDSTPDIGYTYDWMGNPATVTDATGTHVFTYDYATVGHPGLASATVPYILNHSVAYAYDALGRRISMSLMNGATPALNHAYTYDVQNRLASVGNGTHAAHYTRLDGSGLLSNTAIKTSGGTTLLSTDRAYDAYYRMTSIASTAGATTRSYAYTYNDKDQRIKVEINKVGLASDASPRQVASWEYGYDDKGQVVSAVAKDSDGLEIPGYGFGYDYDGIGNRKYEKRGIEAMQFNYISNSVNQYTEVVTPGVVPVIGEADETAEVKALRIDEVPVTSGKQSITATRNGKYFSGAFTGIDNTLAAININYNVYAIIDDIVNDKQLVRREPRQYLLPKAVQPLTYDPDGNMLTNGDWTYTWNGENRLIVAESADKRLEFTYDYMGRRVRKQVYTGSSGNWTLTAESKYVYDGWNCIAIFNGSDVMQKSYLWGEDLSGSLQGAGGVGGLLAVTDDTATYFPMYDGNGNIMTYVDASGTVQADYTYDPFGRTLSQSGTLADSLLYRFSTKRKDFLYDFGKRDYTTELGCWISKDPIGENGGVNLYGFVGNNPISKWDYLGMAAWCHRRKWNKSFINRYHAMTLSGYVGERYDCADLALAILIDFAYTHRLPLTIRNGAGTHRSGSSKFSTFIEYKRKVLKTTATVDLIKNTLKIDIADAQNGDLVIRVNSGNGFTGHTRIFTGIEKDKNTDGLRYKYIAGNGHSGSADPVVAGKQRYIPGMDFEFRRWKFGVIGVWHNSEGETETP